ncbi:hypothetical protein [Streptomyces sp. NPDC048638]|uniref:hypothetical protein n=1 Tax=Streptomyces sp. NPDC048638 TaxID=3365580 RepID=UPI00371FFBC7
MRTMSWPPRACDGSTLAHAYVDLLGWQLLADRAPVTPEQAGELLERAPDGVVQIRCEGFDAVTVPRALGSDALLTLDRGPVRAPSLLVGDEAVTFLVQAGTGGFLAQIPNARVESDGLRLLALPPTRGVRWDTPPWDVYADGPTALEFPDARALLSSLETALRTRRGGS